MVWMKKGCSMQCSALSGGSEWCARCHQRERWQLHLPTSPQLRIRPCLLLNLCVYPMSLTGALHQVQAWGDIDAFELTPATATVQLSARCLPELRSHVYKQVQALTGAILCACKHNQLRATITNLLLLLSALYSPSNLVRVCVQLFRDAGWL